MNKTITIYLSVKFRAFGITFGTMKEAWEVNLNNVSKPFNSIPWTEAPTGNKLYDKQGIKLIVGIVNPL